MFVQAFRFLNIGVRVFKLLGLKVVSVCCNSLSVDHNVFSSFGNRGDCFTSMYYSFTLIYDIHRKRIRLRAFLL